MDNLIKQLNQGILPNELNYNNIQNSDGIDVQKIQYNAFYRTYEFYEKKFPPGHEGIPGFNKIIEHIRDLNINNSPLKEIQERKEIYNDNINES